MFQNLPRLRLFQHFTGDGRFHDFHFRFRLDFNPAFVWGVLRLGLKVIVLNTFARYDAICLEHFIGNFVELRQRLFECTHLLRLRRLPPILLIDEAQEVSPAVLCELHLLASTRFDSRALLSVVLAGDGRLTDTLQREELLPLGSRIRTRLVMEYAHREDLLACLDHLLATAGNPKLMTPELMHTLCDHALGNYRVMSTLAAELLSAAAQREATHLDEKLYLEVFAPPASTLRKSRVGQPR
ncbi:MAG: hypothetical protein ACREYE_00085 [Gammaproteobacteria bacterium]